MEALIKLMSTIANLRSVDAATCERARHYAWHFAHKQRYPNGIYRGLLQ